MVKCNMQFLCLKSFIDTTLQCSGQCEKFKASDEGKAFYLAAPASEQSSLHEIARTRRKITCKHTLGRKL